jgi:hypothetical protein
VRQDRHVSEIRTFADLYRNPMQIAYVAEDLDTACEYLEHTLGTVSTRRSYKSSLGGVVVVDGKPSQEWVIDVALVNAGATNIEVIVPVSGQVELYRRGIRPGAPCTFHHLGVRIDDFDAATAAVKAIGKEWAQYAYTSGGITMGYVDMTPELGHFIEVMEITPTAWERFQALEDLSNAGR